MNENKSNELKKLVPVRLFKDNDKYNADVFVSVNCNNYLIRRGETVMVPQFIKTSLTGLRCRERRLSTIVMRAGNSR